LSFWTEKGKIMSLGIAFKGPEGIVLAADSRVTLTTEIQTNQEKRLLLSTFDNATKLLRIDKRKHIGVVTYGLGAIGLKEPRTAHSFLPELDDRLLDTQQTVKEFAESLSDFFVEQWQETMPEDYSGPPITFLIGGYDDEKAIYGKIFQIDIPSNPNPNEWHSGASFGPVWGGQLQYITRLIKGFDPNLLTIVQKHLGLTKEQIDDLTGLLQGELSSKIPYQFLPLQDCVDLSVFLIRTTMQFQTWQIDVRGVGGAIDVAIITRTKGFELVQHKTIVAGGAIG
jgi:hypothetical protein